MKGLPRCAPRVERPAPRGDAIPSPLTLTASLPFTGERFTPEIKGAIWYEHWHRYCAALAPAAGKRVLDAACGEGYGSWLLAGASRDVTGIDIDSDAIDHARVRYAARPNLRYVRGSCTSLPFADASFDVIVSFETIEHLAEQEAMLDEFRRVLASAGALIISSPNKDVYSGESGGDNHYHVRELTRAELESMLSARFGERAWYGQRVLAHSLLWAEAAGPDKRADLMALADDRVQELIVPATPMYFIIVCAAAGVALPRLPDFSAFDDGAQSLYRDYQRALLAEKRLYWDEIDARTIAEQRLEEAVAAVNELASSREREIALGENVVRLEHESRRLGTELQRSHQTCAELSEALARSDARLAYRESLTGWLRWPLGRLKRMMQGERA